MRKILGIGLALAAMSGCAGDPGLPSTSSTQGTTVVRNAMVIGVEMPPSADAIARLQLRYDNGSVATEEVMTTEVFRVGDKVRVTHSRGTARIERLE
jgi:hypothetical protein